MTRHISDFRIAGLTAVAAIGVLVAIALQALVATLGSVEPVGGHAGDIALDEAREFLYVANFGLARIDLVSLANQSVGTGEQLSSRLHDFIPMAGDSCLLKDSDPDVQRPVAASSLA